MTEASTAVQAITAEQVRALTEQAEEARQRLTRALEVFEDSLGIEAWEKSNPLECGCTTGWFLDADHPGGVLTPDNEVRLRHEVFYTFSRGTHHLLRREVPLSEFPGTQEKS